MINTAMGRTFDYKPKLDPRNNNYLIRHTTVAQELAAVDLWQKSVWWTGGDVLNQGQEGACVPHGVEGEALASPFRVKPKNPQALAFEGYDWCRRNDEWEGEDYDGTSVNTGMKWGRDIMGWWKSYYWAKNMDELRIGLEVGPVVIGVTWYSGMYNTLAGGLVQVGGYVVGGHCLLITGYSPNYGGAGSRFRWRNSWGVTYGLNGNGYIKPSNLNQILFEEGNEAAIARDRSLGRTA